MNVHVIDHPLIQHKLTIMRMKETGTKDFRELLEEISMLMAYEITRDFPLKDVEIETPICKCKEKMLAGKKVGVVPILSAALSLLKEKGAKHIILMCLVAAPEGVRVINHDHPDVPLYVAAIDEKLNEKGYIVPGLGDAGDRIFGTL